MNKILFVCTGNTCRSPMAEAITRYVFNNKGIEAEISSRGVYAVEGQPASANTVLAVKEICGIEMAKHEAKQLQGKDLQRYDFIFTMTEDHKRVIIENYKEYSHKVWAYCQYLQGSERNIGDPYGMSLDAYKKCANELLQLAEKLAEKILAEREETK